MLPAGRLCAPGWSVGPSRFKLWTRHLCCILPPVTPRPRAHASKARLRAPHAAQPPLLRAQHRPERARRPFSQRPGRALPPLPFLLRREGEVFVQHVQVAPLPAFALLVAAVKPADPHSLKGVLRTLWLRAPAGRQATRWSDSKGLGQRLGAHRASVKTTQSPALPSTSMLPSRLSPGTNAESARNHADIAAAEGSAAHLGTRPRSCSSSARQTPPYGCRAPQAETAPWRCERHRPTDTARVRARG